MALSHGAAYRCASAIKLLLPLSQISLTGTLNNLTIYLEIDAF